ncbi:MAG TPA: ferritin-like domain-containing protein [Bradyrhizobium sp.]|jgi:hypothetical protein|nr:ferritin-like domain-containing protein [Bradyrhizobium sp.]
MPSSKKNPLRWRAHTVDPGRSDRMRSLTQKSIPGLGPLANDAAAVAATLDLPDLTAFPTPLGKAVRLLQAAAAIEHALMVQYLYAGSTFSGNIPADMPKIAENYRAIIGIAIEEMAHLMTVQNLLKLIGADPDLSRQDFGPPDSDADRLFPFDMLFEPVTHESLAKYVVAESPKEFPSGIDPALMARIITVATQGSGTPVNRVGTLYALLGAVFGSETLLAQKASTGDPWYAMVNDLAAEAARAYGGRDRLHLPESAFQPASVSAQSSDRDWDRSVVKNLDEFRVHVVDGREAALEALRDIGLQGEGPSLVTSEDAHFIRFVNLFKIYGADGTGTGPAPSAAAVPRAAVITVDEQSAASEAISHPDSVRWARFANSRYAVMLGSLELYLRQAPTDRSFLLGWCFAEMFAIKFLSGVLTKKPRTTQAGPGVAAVPFTLPAWTGTEVTWPDLEVALTAAMTEATAILAAGGTTDEQKRVLGHIMTSDQRKLAEVQARKSNSTVRRKPDRARETLDWTAGASDPPHPGDSPPFPNQDQGRFWNLAVSDFKQTSIFGANIVTPVVPGTDSPMIRRLRTGDMPRNRPPLSPTEPEFLFLEAWVKNGCPDDPV